MESPMWSSSSSGHHRDESPSPWNDLPGHILHSILLRLTACIFDFFAFSGVCQSWRSEAFASKADYMSSDSRPRFRILYHGCGSFGIQSVADPHLCWAKNHHTLQAMDIVGFSFGYLIVLDGNPRLLDPLSGHTILLPKLPPTATSINRAILSSPPSSSQDCLVLGWDRLQYNLLSCPVTGEQRHWTEDPWPYPYGFTYYSAVHGGKLFAITLTWSLPNVSLVIMDLALRQTELVVLPYWSKLDARLAWVDARGEVWVWEQETKCVYRLNSERSEWERMENLGGRSLFLGFQYWIQYISENPIAWGGRENSVYCLSSSEKIDAIERIGRRESLLALQIESQLARQMKSKLARWMESWYCEIVMWV